MEKILYKKGQYGFLEYKIKTYEDGLKFMSNGCLHKEIITVGKAGRSLEDQKLLRLNARVRSKLDDGFKYTKEEASKGITNQLGLIKPMLAKRLSPIKLDMMMKKYCYLQPKLDGHRCLLNSEIMYSRAGRIIDTLDHIKTICDVLPKNITLDGELYIHGESLQTISSYIKRRQEGSKSVRYVIYDMYDSEHPNMTYELRKIELLRYSSDSIDICDTVSNIGYKETIQKHLQDGYEGSILRLASGMYGIGKRSSDLIKIKPTMDECFKCADIVLSERNTGYCNFVLVNRYGFTFKTPVFGTVENKKRAIYEKEKYVGNMIECKFANYTNDLIPFHCVALRIVEQI